MTTDRDDPALPEAVPSLAARAYFDPLAHERELHRIWRRHWICAGRTEEIARAREFRQFRIADHGVLLLRDEQGGLRAFLDSCRHRGASLCASERGRLARAAIVCPYHAWTYDLQGRLLRTGAQHPPVGFDRDAHGLRPLPVREWNGFVFCCLDPDPPPFDAGFDQPLERLDAWRLGDCLSVHRTILTIACNWKVFWENYNECLHCPGVHPELARLVPAYGRGLLEARDDPDWRGRAAAGDPSAGDGLRPGARSWTTTGEPIGPEFPGLGDADRHAGHVYVTAMPSLFVVGHVDYARAVRLRPLGPETTELRVDYLVPRETCDAAGFDPAPAIAFAERVLGEDAAICETNQRGLRAAPEARGTLLPEEYAVRAFHAWLRAEGAVD
jgi:Rieske 2Fe-2S family protein